MRDINLLKENAVTSKTKSSSQLLQGFKLSTKHLIVLVAVVIVMAAGFLVPYLMMSVKEKQKETLEIQLSDSKYNDIRKLLQQADQIQASYGVKEGIVKYVGNNTNPLSQIRLALQGSLPKGCMVTEYSIKDNTVQVAFTAQNSYVASEFISNITSSSFFALSDSFKNVTIPNTNSPLTLSITLQIKGKG